MSLVLNVEILGEFKKLTAATQGASTQLSGLQKSAQTISRNIGRAFATIGLGLSFAVIVNGLKDASKAAVEDAKSQQLLAKALKNTTGANNLQVASVEKSISKMSLQSAIADDKLRPAFANLVRATGDITKSTELMSLALDVSAGTGKDVEAVVKALSRAVGPDGTTGALERLVPAIKGANDPLAELERLFAGSAEKAAQTDPYQRLQVAFGEISESIGTILLPLLEKFATWLVDIVPDVQKFFRSLIEALDSPAVREAYGSLDRSLKNLAESLAKLFGITTGPEANGFVSFFVTVAQILDGIVQTVNLLVDTFKKAFPIFNTFANLVNSIANALVSISGYEAPEAPVSGGSAGRSNSPRSTGSFSGNTTININKGNVTATEIVRKINKKQKVTGRRQIRNFGSRRAI
jgi:hypothetical protein